MSEEKRLLKTTYKPQPVALKDGDLPPGWTEHKAPTGTLPSTDLADRIGHTYYYNATTKKSTYSRPTLPPSNTSAEQEVAETQDRGNETGLVDVDSLPEHLSSISFRGGQGAQHGFRGQGGQHSGRIPRKPRRRRRKKYEDGPKARESLPGAEPWVLVRTKFGRRFIHNPETKESFWKIPDELVEAVSKFDELERAVAEAEFRKQQEAKGVKRPAEFESESEEEEDEEEQEEILAKRQKLDAPQEFNEEDIAYQLANEGYEFDPDDLAGEDPEPEPEEDESSKATFMEMLDDFKINPFSTWEKVIEEGKIIEDDRYLLLPNMKARRAAWDQWTTGRIKMAQALKAQARQKDPLAEFLAFLSTTATPKLYFPEYKRKHRKHSAFGTSKVAEKDKEKLYRSLTASLKTSSSDRTSQFAKTLKALPRGLLWRSIDVGEAGKDGDVGDLPKQLWSETSFWAVDEARRKVLLETFLAELPDEGPPGHSEQNGSGKRDAAEKALRDRERQVQAARQRTQQELRRGKDELDYHAREISDAMKVSRDGLLSQVRSEPAAE